MQPKIALFDLDGVFIQPDGYREAVRACVSHYLRGLKLITPYVPDDVMEYLEAIGVTNEWDMIPIILSIILDFYLNKNPGTAEIVQGKDFPVAPGICDIRGDDYYAVIKKLKTLLSNGMVPAEAILSSCSNGKGMEIFPYFSAQPLFKELLSNTRHVEKSRSTRFFQHYVLGSSVFSTTYQLPVEFNTESFLVRHDQPLLEPNTLKWLQEIISNRKINCCIYTARPSLPPREVEYSKVGYSPEAEMAAELVGLGHIPLIAYGRLIALGEHIQMSPDVLVKPAPVQALAAIGAATCGNEWSGLKWAGNLWLSHMQNSSSSNTQKEMIEIQNGTEIYVFEDSPVGLQAVEKAAQILQDSGIQINCRFFGIAKNPDKAAALNALGADVFENINLALKQALLPLIG